MTIQLWYIGWTHRSAPLGVRERMKPASEQCRAVLEQVGAMAEGRMIVNTCERFELYASGVRADTWAWVSCLANTFDVSPVVMGRHARTLANRSVAEHLLRVASGLDSRVLGEPQVLGQVREAYQMALDAHFLDARLAALGRSAIRAGRRVRHETPINRGRESIAHLAVAEVLRGLAGPASGALIAVLGNGRLAADVVTALRGEGVKAPMVIARDKKAGQALAERAHARFTPWNEMRRVVLFADAVVACTSAKSYLIDAATLAGRRRDPMTLMDLGVPRNIDPQAAQRPGVRLVHLDDFLSSGAPSMCVLAPALDIIDQELAEFDQWCRERKAAPRIAALVRRAHAQGLPMTADQKRVLHERIVELKRCVFERKEAAA